MSKYFTVVYRYNDDKEMQEWAEREVYSKMCCHKSNENLPVQVTGWAVGDTLLELQLLQEANQSGDR